MCRELKLEFDDNVLLCPGCGGTNTHHSIVSVFSRGSEDAEPTVVAVANAYTSMTPREAGPLFGTNPSMRRDGVAILFWCEACDFVGELTISQHKGSTYFAWRE